MAARRRKNIECNATLPYITYAKARTSWFIHNNTAYSLELAPDDIFKAAVLQLMPKAKKTEKVELDSYYRQILTPLYYDEIDMLSRWYIITALKSKVKLFSSREDAEASIHLV